MSFSELLLENTDVILFIEKKRTNKDIKRFTCKSEELINSVRKELKEFNHQQWLKRRPFIEYGEE